MNRPGASCLSCLDSSFLEGGKGKRSNDDNIKIKISSNRIHFCRTFYVLCSILRDLSILTHFIFTNTPWRWCETRIIPIPQVWKQGTRRWGILTTLTQLIQQSQNSNPVAGLHTHAFNHLAPLSLSRNYIAKSCLSAEVEKFLSS